MGMTFGTCSVFLFLAAPLTPRHYFVSTLLHGGVDKQTVADLAGHGDTAFLERTYCHPQMELKRNAAKVMHAQMFRCG